MALKIVPARTRVGAFEVDLRLSEQVRNEFGLVLRQEAVTVRWNENVII